MFHLIVEDHFMSRRVFGEFKSLETEALYEHLTYDIHTGVYVWRRFDIEHNRWFFHEAGPYSHRVA